MSPNIKSQLGEFVTSEFSLSTLPPYSLSHPVHLTTPTLQSILLATHFEYVIPSLQRCKVSTCLISIHFTRLMSYTSGLAPLPKAKILAEPLSKYYHVKFSLLFLFFLVITQRQHSRPCSGPRTCYPLHSFQFLVLCCKLLGRRGRGG